MHIPDPVEVLEAQMEAQADLIDSNGEYPCARCGVRFPVEDMFPASEHPATPLLCNRCALAEEPTP